MISEVDKDMEVKNHGNITVIPKKDKDCIYIKNYRPISLLTVDYEIFAKVLANP